MIALMISEPDPRPRARTRTVDIQALARYAIQTGEIQCAHGGSVCNSYGYSASTNVALACPIEIAPGRVGVVVWQSFRPANKITESGAAEECLSGSRAAFDRRAKAEHRVAALALIRREAEEILREKGGEVAIQWAIGIYPELAALTPSELAATLLIADGEPWHLERIEVADPRVEPRAVAS